MRGENGTESLVVFFFCFAYSNRKTKCQNYTEMPFKSDEKSGKVGWTFPDFDF